MTTAQHLGDEGAQRLLEGLLPAAEAGPAEAHLAACPACRALVESHRALAAALEGLAAPEPPPDFTPRSNGIGRRAATATNPQVRTIPNTLCPACGSREMRSGHSCLWMRFLTNCMLGCCKSTSVRSRSA